MTYEQWEKSYISDHEPVITEMCDVCGKSYAAPIFRKKYSYKENLNVVIRYCYFCNPDIYFEKVFRGNI